MGWWVQERVYLIETPGWWRGRGEGDWGLGGGRGASLQDIMQCGTPH